MIFLQENKKITGYFLCISTKYRYYFGNHQGHFNLVILGVIFKKNPVSGLSVFLTSVKSEF